MSGFPPNSQSAIDKAASSGMVVVYPTDCQLQIDIDGNEAYGTFLCVLPTLQQHFPVAKVETHLSKSGGEKRHVTVTLEKPVMSNMERVLLQACLGSDGIREMLSYIQVLDRDPHPILFLENPVAVGMANVQMPTPIERQLTAGD